MKAILLCLALSVSACSALPNYDARNMGRAFSLPALTEASEPELRLWITDLEGGAVTGYVVQRGQIAIYQAAAPVRIVETYAADEVLALIPRLRRVRAENCALVMDGSSVAVEGVDGGQYFSFSVDNHWACEGWNLHVLDYALRTVSVEQAN